jgi:hypothetical protein
MFGIETRGTPDAGGVELGGVHVADVKGGGGPELPGECENGAGHGALSQRCARDDAGEA